MLDDDGRPEPAPDMTKPPYQIPSMAELRAVEPSGLVGVSTFAGAGGSSTGYRMAGIRMAAAVECAAMPAAAYRANWPDSVVLEHDIRAVAPEALLELAGCAIGELDLLDGSPPCVSFSVAGKREQSWGTERTHAGMTQRTDDLFTEYMRLLGAMQPRAFVAENVTGMYRGKARGFFLEALEGLRSCGYRVACKEIAAEWLGVPQSRHRLIFVGIRNDLESDPVYPKPLPYRYTMADAFAGASLYLPPMGFRGVTQRRAISEPSPTLLGEAARNPMIIDASVVSRPSQHGPPTRRSVSEPAQTLIAEPKAKPEIDNGTWITTDPETGENLLHRVKVPSAVTHRRRLTLGEARRLCGFPDDYELAGSYEQRWAQLGNSVPPPVTAAVGRELVKLLGPRASVKQRSRKAG